MLVDDREVRVTSPDRVLVDGVTKAAALEYFLAVGDGILGALRDRPVMLERRRDDTVFFQRRLPQGAPEWVATVRGPEYDLVCPDDLATVAWMVNLGAVTFHPWPVRRDAMHTPDRLLIDLDPQAGTGFEEAVAVARMVREVLHERELEGFPKTSGGRGLHILVPLATPQPWGDVQALREGIGHEVVERHPRTRDDAAAQTRSRGSCLSRLRPADGRLGVLDPPRRLRLGTAALGGARHRVAAGLRRRLDARAVRQDRRPRAVKPMLAKLVADIPPGLYYEPKWDGFRAIVVK